MNTAIDTTTIDVLAALRLVAGYFTDTRDVFALASTSRDLRLAIRADQLAVEDRETGFKLLERGTLNRGAVSARDVLGTGESAAERSDRGMALMILRFETGPDPIVRDHATRLSFDGRTWACYLSSGGHHSSYIWPSMQLYNLVRGALEQPFLDPSFVLWLIEMGIRLGLNSATYVSAVLLEIKGALRYPSFPSIRSGSEGAFRQLVTAFFRIVDGSGVLNNREIRGSILRTLIQLTSKSGDVELARMIPESAPFLRSGYKQAGWGYGIAWEELALSGSPEFVRMATENWGMLALDYDSSHLIALSTVGASVRSTAYGRILVMILERCRLSTGIFPSGLNCVLRMHYRDCVGASKTIKSEIHAGVHLTALHRRPLEVDYVRNAEKILEVLDEHMRAIPISEKEKEKETELQDLWIEDVD